MPRSKSKNKYYAVARGRRTGIFATWPECKASVNGHPKARFKSFQTREEAVEFLRQNSGAVAAAGVHHVPAAAAAAEHPTKKRAAETPAEVLHHQAATTANKKQSRTAAAAPSSAALRIAITFDGGARGNPGVAGAGASVTLTQHGNNRVWHIRDFCGIDQTNNQAEYQGIVAALRLALRETRRRLRDDDPKNSKAPAVANSIHLICQGDSKLVIQQLKGVYQCHSDKLRSRLGQATRLLEEFRNMAPTTRVTLEHVYRADNKVADGACVVVLRLLLFAVLFVGNAGLTHSAFFLAVSSNSNSAREPSHGCAPILDDQFGG